MIPLRIQNSKFKVLAQCVTHRNHDSTAIIKNSMSAFIHHVLPVYVLHIQ